MAYSKYYRMKLSPEEKVIYDKIVLALERKEALIHLPPFSPDSLQRILYTAVNFDYPELFYVNYRCCFFASTPFGMVLRVDYLLPVEEIERTKTAIEREADAILREYHGSTPEEAELYLHDALITRCTYDKDPSHPTNAHNLIGPFLNRKCVCEGYAKAFQYLADRIKLPCITVTGTASDGVRPAGPHAWNMVRIRKKAYHVDVTFDSFICNRYPSRAYYNLSTAEISRDHEISPDFPMPDCPENAARIPVIGSMNILMRYLRGEASRGAVYSEVRLPYGFDNGDVLGWLRRNAAPDDSQWIGRMQRLGTKGNHILFVIWA